MSDIRKEIPTTAQTREGDIAIMESLPIDEAAALSARVESVRTALLAVIDQTNVQESRHLRYVSGRVHGFRESTERNLLKYIADIRPDELLVLLNYNVESLQSDATEMKDARILRENAEKFGAMLSAIGLILGTLGASQTGKDLITSAFESQGYMVDTNNTQDLGDALVEYIHHYADGGVDEALDRAAKIEFSALVAQAVLEIIEPYHDVVVAILESTLDEKEKKKLLFKLVTLEEDSWPGLFTTYLAANPWIKE